MDILNTYRDGTDILLGDLMPLQLPPGLPEACQSSSSSPGLYMYLMSSYTICAISLENAQIYSLGTWCLLNCPRRVARCLSESSSSSPGPYLIYIVVFCAFSFRHGTDILLRDQGNTHCGAICCCLGLLRRVHRACSGQAHAAKDGATMRVYPAP